VQAESWPTQGEHSSPNSRSDKKPWYARRQSARDSGAKAPVFIVIFCGRTTFCDGVSHFSLSLPYGDCFNFLIGLFFWLVACSKPYIRHRFRSCWAHARGMLCLVFNALSFTGLVTVTRLNHASVHSAITLRPRGPTHLLIG